MSIDSIDADDNATLLNKIRLTPEAKSEIYRRYLKNLNYSQNGNDSAHAYADLFFKAENFSSFDVDMEITTTSDYLPRDLPFTVTHSHIFTIVLIVIYAIIFVLGVLGNVVTCIVIAKNRSMHTAVNFYLFSLAVSDLLLLVTALPEEVYLLWFPEYPFGEIVCKFHKFAAESFTNATVFTITAFTMERYVAICKPFLSHTLSKLSRACKLILGIWVLSIALAIPQTLFTLHIDKEYHMCIPRTESQHYFAISTFLMFVIPMSVITILYILIGLQLRKSKIVQRGNVNGSSVRLKRKIFNKKATNQTLVTVNTDSHYNEALLQHNNDINRNYAKNNFIDAEAMSIPEDGRINYSTNRAQVHHGSKHIVKMLVVVVIAFAVCWSPFHLQRLLFSYIEPSALNQDLSFCINYGSGVLFFISTCINPFLYNIMSNKFREAFKVTISKYFYGRHKERDVFTGGRLFRTISQRSYSMNSTSLNTCSSICSMQPYSSQNQTFRYFDSKRPLVVSFRRINKVTLPNNPPNSAERCNSICDIHRIDLNRVGDNRMSMKSKYFHRLAPSGASHSQSCRNFNGIDNRKNYYETNESPQRDKITITYPKEKFHGNAKLHFTINDDILRHNQHLYNSMNTTTKIPHMSSKSSRMLQNRKALYRNELIKNDILRDDFNGKKLKPTHKSTSTPSLVKLANFPNALEIDENEKKRSFTSVLNVRPKEIYLVRNSKSY